MTLSGAVWVGAENLTVCSISVVVWDCYTRGAASWWYGRKRVIELWFLVSVYGLYKC